MFAVCMCRRARTKWTICGERHACAVANPGTHTADPSPSRCLRRTSWPRSAAIAPHKATRGGYGRFRALQRLFSGCPDPGRAMHAVQDCTESANLEAYTTGGSGGGGSGSKYACCPAPEFTLPLMSSLVVWCHPCCVVRCFECKQVGHVARNCPFVQCYKCGGSGHRARDCQSASECNQCGSRNHRTRDCPDWQCHRCGKVHSLVCTMGTCHCAVGHSISCPCCLAEWPHVVMVPPLLCRYAVHAVLYVPPSRFSLPVLCLSTARPVEAPAVVGP